MTFEIHSIGIENPQYYQGASVVFSDWTAVEVGVGWTEREAVMDAIETWSCAVDVPDEVYARAIAEAEGSDVVTVADALRADGVDAEDIEETELQFYVELYWRA